MSHRGFFIGLKYQLFPLSFSHRKCWMSVVYLQVFHCADELGITDMNSVGCCLGINFPCRIFFNSHLVATWKQ